MRLVSVFAMLLTLTVICVAFANEAAPATEVGHEASHGGANMHLLPKPQPNKNLSAQPGRPTLQSPAPLSMVSGASTTLKWNEVQGADSYHVQVATDPNFKWLVSNEFFVKGSSFDVKGLEAGKQYFWRVAGMKSDNGAGYMKGDFTASSFQAQ